MSHIPASNDLFRKSYIFVKLGHFWPISRKSHFGRFVHMWHRRGETIIFREIIFTPIFFSGTVHLVPETVKFWFWGEKQGLKWFYNTLNSENSIFSTIFWSILEVSKWCKNTSSSSSKCCKIILNHVFHPKTKISPSREPNEQFQTKKFAKK